ncbi:MAG: RDD family protein [Chloroflexi bacterium]|nr:MAG: RDD family protein [Chloroflexota bacterium]
MAHVIRSTVKTNIDSYVKEVMSLIHASKEQQARIEADLRSHLQEGLDHGEDPADLIARMGEPREVAAGFMEQVPLVYAGFWRRFAAFLVDMVVILFFAGAAATLTIILSNSVPQNPTGLENILGAAVIVLILISANACIAIILIYFPLLEGRFGQTLGKKLFHLYVLTEDGLPVGYGKATLRRLSFYFEILPIDALWIFFNPRRQRGFDILANTIVVES